MDCRLFQNPRTWPSNPAAVGQSARRLAASIPHAGGNKRSVCSRRVSRASLPAPSSTTGQRARALQPRSAWPVAQRNAWRRGPRDEHSRWSCLGPHTTTRPQGPIAAPCNVQPLVPVMWRIVHRSCASGRSGTSAARSSTDSRALRPKDGGSLLVDSPESSYRALSPGVRGGCPESDNGPHPPKPRVPGRRPLAESQICVRMNSDADPRAYRNPTMARAIRQLLTLPATLHPGLPICRPALPCQPPP